MVRFGRQRNRVASALLTPIIFWVLLGFGFSGSFTAEPAPIPQETGGTTTTTSVTPAPAVTLAAAEVAPPVSYLEYFFPGTIVFILLSTAIFSTISVIEDRREGFLQGVLVSPAPRLAIVMGKVLGGAGIATIQGLLFLLLWPLIGQMPETWGMVALVLIQSVAVMFLLAVGLTALGLCIAWPMDSTAGFHAVMMIFLMPMWFLSGAVFPLTGTPFWLKMLMLANPLTYGQTAFAWALTGGRVAVGAPVAPITAMLVLVAFVVLTVSLAVWLVNRPRKDGLA